MSYVREVMRMDVTTAKIGDPIPHISKLLAKKNISNIPVINENEELVGIVSEQDIIRAMESKDFMKKTARDIMTKDVLSVKEHDPLEYVSKIFIERPFRRLPVTRNKKIVGIITREEIIKSFMSDHY